MKKSNRFTLIAGVFVCTVILVYLAVPCLSEPAMIKRIEIAGNLPLTGPMAAFSGLYPNGFQWGIDDASKEHGIPVESFHVDFQDNQGSPTIGVTVAQKQLAVGFDIYLSGLSNATQALAKDISATKKPHFLVAFDSELLRNDPNKFRILPHLRLESPLWIEYASKKKAKRVFILHANFPAYHEQYSMFIEPGLRKLGIEFHREVFDFGKADFRVLALKAKMFNPDLVFFTSLASDLSSGILNQSTQHWYTGSTHKRVISVRPGHRVYGSRVD